MRYLPAKPLMFVALAVALAMPAPAMACCHGGTEFGTCGHPSTTSAVAPTDCCHHTIAAAAQHNCGSTGQPCLCSQPADPRSASTDRIADHVQPNLVLALTAIAPITPDANFSADSQPAPPGALAAIPHRILHCAWLI